MEWIWNDKKEKNEIWSEKYLIKNIKVKVFCKIFFCPENRTIVV